MRTLVLCDDRWHPAPIAREGLGALGKTGVEFDWIENSADWSAERMNEYQQVIFVKANNVSAADETHWVTDEIAQAFVDYVERGNGLLVIHSGTALYKEVLPLRSLMGGVFDMHPPQCLVTVTPKTDHALTQGSSTFTLKDEHYHMILDDPTVDIFLTATSEHGEQPAGWTRTEGRGRVCVLTPGHNLEVWLHPSYQALIRNGLSWCAEETK